MPDILNPTLSRQNRLELIEYHKAHQSDSSVNRFGNKAYLALSDSLNQHLIVKNTSTSTFEMKLNHLADSTMYIGIIRTTCAQVCMSTLEFYDTAWNVIPLHFAMPKAIEWVDTAKLNTSEIDNNWLNKLVEMCFISASFDKQNNIICVENNTLDFLSQDDRKLLKSLFSEKHLTYKLKDKCWVRE